MTTEDSGIPAATAEDHPDAELLRLKREIENASNTGNTAATDKEAGPYFDLATKLRHELAEIPAHTLEGIIAKFDDYQRIHEGGATSVWDEDLLRTIREGLERLKPSADAKLFALEVEMKEAHEGFHAAAAVVGSTDEDHQPWYDRMIAVEEAAQAIAAQTAVGVLAKLRMAAWYVKPEPADTDDSDEIWLRNIVADAQRIGATVAVDSDAALQDLWREHQQCLKDWGPDETPDDEKARDRAFELERQIVETPAQSIFGVAVKLWIATHDNLPYKRPEYTDEKALVGARDDAVRLAGIGGAA